MKTNPKSEAALREEMLLPAGDYDFEVLDAVDKLSQKGNEMIAVKLAVFRPNGSRQYVNDWLMEKMAFKLRHFCYSVGLGEKYEAGDLDAESCKGRTGRVTLKIEEQEGFGSRNAVKDYAPVQVDAKPAPAATPKLPVGVDDGSVPF